LKRSRLSCFFILFFGTFFVYGQDLSKYQIQRIDSIVDFREKSRDKELSIEERFSFAERARRISNELKIDSTIIKSNRRISSIYREQKNYNLFKKINRGAYLCYYNAEKIYTSINDRYNAGRVLLNMAIIQKNEKDYIGSENTAITAISFLEAVVDSVPKAYRPLSSLYNNLAIVSEELEQYDKAIEYYNKAIGFHKKSNSSNSLIQLFYLNNLGIVYRESGQYDKALKYFQDLLDKEKLFETDPSFYARVLDNLARTKFLVDKDDKDLPRLFLKSLTIKDSIDDKGGSMRSNVHLADYYLSQKTPNTAKKFADTAYVVADKYNRHDDKLEILLLLAKIEKGDKALRYTQEYIALNDSLQKEERAIRNKFGRIKFDTDKIEAENIQISRERELFLILAISALVAAFLIYIIISQRSKNNKLRFNQEQQKANEEIYNLMLSQQDKIDEGRAKEKQRISEDLHDGILYFGPPVWHPIEFR